MPDLDDINIRKTLQKLVFQLNSNTQKLDDMTQLLELVLKELRSPRKI